MPKKYDVIVIGGGIGGLTAAAILSKNGRKVILVEQKPFLGGYISSFKRDGFNFETSLHMMDSCTKGAHLYNILKQSGISNRVKFLKPKYLYRSIFPDYSVRVPQANNISWYVEKMSQNFSSEKKGIKKFVKKIEYIYKNFYDLKVTKYTDKISKYKEMLSYTSSSVSSLTDMFIKNHKLKAVMQQLWLYAGSPPAELSSLYFSYLWYGFNHYGGFYPEGGSSSLIAAYKNSIIENGGKVVVDETVQKIMLNNNQAKGIISKNIGRIEGKFIVSNVDALTTYNKLVGKDRLNKFFVKRLEHMTPSMSVFQCFLGLKDFLLPEDFCDDYQIFLNPIYDFTKSYYAALRNDTHNATMVLTLHSNLSDKKRKIDKNFIMSIYTASKYEYWKRLSRNEYLDKKQELTEKLIERVAKLFPGVKKFIKTKEAITPLSLEKMTGNYKGAIFGWAQSPRQSGLKRLSMKSPVDNLYLVGAWSQPGGGIVGSMHSGKNVAEDIMGR